MMLFKIAAGNVKKSIRDFAIYFMTLAFAVCIFYMFNSIEAQEELMSVTKMKHAAMQTLSSTLGYMSVFVSVVLGLLIVYANNFLVRRRKKELGIYMTLGMEKGKISLILMMETLMIGIFALITGLVAGIFMSQLMSIFTAKLFEADMTSFKFIFSPKAAAKSIMYFGLIFAVVMSFNFVSIAKCSLIKLLYADSKNEEFKTRSVKLSIALFAMSIISLGFSYYFIIKNGMMDLNMDFTMSIVLGSLGTLLFFMSLSGIALRLLQKNKSVYFRGLNIFVMRQIASKVNTAYVSMSIICIILLLAIGTFSSGMSVNEVANQKLEKGTVFDNSFIHFNSDGELQGENDIYAQIDGIYPLDGKTEEYEQYTVYKANVWLRDILSPEYSEGVYKWMGDREISIISLSDYNNALYLQGKKGIGLAKGEFAINCTKEEVVNYVKYIAESGKAFSIGGKELRPGFNMIFNESIVNDEDFFVEPMFIVNDELVKGLDMEYIVLNVKYNEFADGVKIDEDIDMILNEYRGESEASNTPFDIALSKTRIHMESISASTIATFLAIYLGFVFLVACVAILALQQLSEAADNKKRYDLLQKIGAEKDLVKRALFVQVLVYFMMPLLLAIVHSIVGLSVANNVIASIGKINAGKSIFITAAFFTAIYGGYFAATCAGCKSIILRD
ncbi:putative ABC transport system permease protein [Peptoclostridium litorale DSM 5388]|uniref:Bacitracin export permease protein BceB n=1 Tax=Peptoclostridium litorale DSM 5388 TaxID=1121324 RepID=A0A069RN95_PEPLI|nr:ABC transporter permease [Peptoclostridium litorale]KDR95627.1 bacitracin export permease protein BceB [Peptoclostridium litorale DSM 5388]SIN99738.1 putative ABC transport system permease protein [Peptoclostridium litorale DSM 5388]